MSEQNRDDQRQFAALEMFVQVVPNACSKPFYDHFKTAFKAGPGAHHKFWFDLKSAAARSSALHLRCIWRNTRISRPNRASEFLAACGISGAGGVPDPHSEPARGVTPRHELLMRIDPYRGYHAGNL